MAGRQGGGGSGMTERESVTVRAIGEGRAKTKLLRALPSTMPVLVQ